MHETGSSRHRAWHQANPQNVEVGIPVHYMSCHKPGSIALEMFFQSFSCLYIYSIVHSRNATCCICPINICLGVRTGRASGYWCPSRVFIFELSGSPSMLWSQDWGPFGIVIIMLSLKVTDSWFPLVLASKFFMKRQVGASFSRADVFSHLRVKLPEAGWVTVLWNICTVFVVLASENFVNMCRPVTTSGFCFQMCHRWIMAQMSKII